MGTHNFRLLQGSLSSPDLVRELAYLERLLYKNKQQHRASQHFQRLQEVHKYLQLWKKLQIPHLIGELSATSAAWGHAGNGTAEQPAGSLGLLTLQRLIAGCQLMEALQPAVHKAAAALSAQLALSFFMPLCLTAFANLARVRVLGAQWVLDAVQAYNSLVDYVPTLPLQPPAGCDLPQMLKCEWVAGLPHAVQMPYPLGDSFAARVATHLAQQLSSLAAPRAAGNRSSHMAPDDDDLAGEKVELRPSLPSSRPDWEPDAAVLPTASLAALGVFEDRGSAVERATQEAGPLPLYSASAALQGPLPKTIHSPPLANTPPQQHRPAAPSRDSSNALQAPAQAAFSLLWPLAHFRAGGDPHSAPQEAEAGEQVFGAVEVIRSAEEELGVIRSAEEELGVMRPAEEEQQVPERTAPVAAGPEDVEMDDVAALQVEASLDIAAEQMSEARADTLEEPAKLASMIDDVPAAILPQPQLQELEAQLAGSSAAPPEAAQRDVGQLSEPAQLAEHAQLSEPAQAAQGQCVPDQEDSEPMPLYAALAWQLSDTLLGAAPAAAPAMSDTIIDSGRRFEAAMSSRDQAVPDGVSGLSLGPGRAAEEPPRQQTLSLPKSKAEQKRQRQLAAAARSREQQQQQPPQPQQRGSWEDWLQAPTAQLGAPTGAPLLNAGFQRGGFKRGPGEGMRGRGGRRGGHAQRGSRGGRRGRRRGDSVGF